MFSKRLRVFMSIRERVSRCFASVLALLVCYRPLAHAVRRFHYNRPRHRLAASETRRKSLNTSFKMPDFAGLYTHGLFIQLRVAIGFRSCIACKDITDVP